MLEKMGGSLGEVERACQIRRQVWLWVIEDREKKGWMEARSTTEEAKESSKESLARLWGSPWAKVTLQMGPISPREEPAFSVLHHCLGAACGTSGLDDIAVMDFSGCQSQQQLGALGQLCSLQFEDCEAHSHGCHSLWFIQKLVWKTCFLYATDGNVFKILRKHLVGQIPVSNYCNFFSECWLFSMWMKSEKEWYLRIGWNLFFCIRCEQFYNPEKVHEVWWRIQVFELEQ